MEKKHQRRKVKKTFYENQTIKFSRSVISLNIRPINEVIRQITIISLLILINLSLAESRDFQYAEDLAIDDDFGQEKGFSRIIAQPNQNFKLEIDSYFRGQFLRYNMTGFTVTEQALIETGVITINSAVEETNRLTLSQSPNPLASFYTESIFYLDQQDGNPSLNYFFFIDQNLNLIAYDITNYATKFASINRKPVVQINLYDPKQLSSFKSCSHLLQIGNNYVVTICQAAADKNGTIVFTQFGTGKQSGTVQYMNSSISYKEIMNGRLRLFDFNLKNMVIDLILLRNKSSSFFEIISLDVKHQKVYLKAVVKNITYPNFSLKKDTFDYNEVEKPQIQDVLAIPQQRGMVLLSEYSSGMFILNILCEEKNCTAQTKSVVSFPNSGGLQLLKIKVNDFVPKALASMVQPPTILEINVQDSFNPYISRKYMIQVDQDDYLGLSVLDADERFIVFAILRIDDFRPFL